MISLWPVNLQRTPCPPPSAFWEALSARYRYQRREVRVWGDISSFPDIWTCPILDLYHQRSKRLLYKGLVSSYLEGGRDQCWQIWLMFALLWCACQTANPRLPSSHLPRNAIEVKHDVYQFSPLTFFCRLLSTFPFLLAASMSAFCYSAVLEGS